MKKNENVIKVPVHFLIHAIIKATNATIEHQIRVSDADQSVTISQIVQNFEI